MPKGVYDRQPIEDRILEQISEDEITGCWVWNGHLDKDGYGQTSDRCRTRQVHRVMYELKKGAVPTGSLVGHLCDDKYPKDCKNYRKCCNPEHLVAMTNKENTQRASELGRLKITSGAFTTNKTGGENNIKAKLTAEKVIEIRTKGSKAGYGDWPKLAEEYGVQYQTLYKIMKGKLWNKPIYFPTPE
jgi:hypothetical protein